MWNGRLILRNERFNNGVFAADATSARLLIWVLLWLNLNGVLVEDGPLALDLVDVLILLLGFVANIDVAALVTSRNLLWFALLRGSSRHLELERPTLDAGESGADIWKNCRLDFLIELSQSSLSIFAPDLMLVLVAAGHRPVMAIAQMLAAK